MKADRKGSPKGSAGGKRPATGPRGGRHAKTMTPATLLRRLFPSIQGKGPLPLHPTEYALTEFVQDRLPPLAQTAVRLHLRRCPECLDVVEDIREVDAPITDAEREVVAPRVLREALFVQTVRDTALRVERVLCGHGRAIKIVPALEVVPSFFKKPCLVSGLTPQAHFSNTLEALAEVLPAGSVIRLSADVREEDKTESFVAKVECLPGPCRISETHLCIGSGPEGNAADAVAFQVLHPFWTSQKIGLCPAACRLPAKTVSYFLEALTLETVSAINALFRDCPSCRWTSRDEATLRTFFEFMSQEVRNTPLSSLLLPPQEIGGEDCALPVAALIARFRTKAESQLREVEDLRLIVAHRDEQVAGRTNMFSQFGSRLPQA